MSGFREKIEIFLAQSRRVQRQTGKSPGVQLREIAELRTLGGQCSASDYYQFKLYDDGYLKGRGRADFLGWRLLEKFSLALNPRFAVLPAWDKSVFTQMAGGAGLPIAPVKAFFYAAQHIPTSMGLHLKRIEDVADFLRVQTSYPLFGKPAFSQQGFGAAHLASYDKSSDRLTLMDGSAIQMQDFLRRLVQTVDRRYHRPECGYLFQETFSPAPEIFQLTGWPAICGVRIICLNANGNVRPIRAVWKVAVQPNHVDNFSLGKNGNMLADINLTTGEVSRLIGGFWPDTEIFETHPTTKRRLAGFMLPGWDKVLDACQLAGAVFPLMHVHHWDFALTDKGPLMLELNDIGGTNIPQLHGHGLLTPETREFLKSHADKRQHSWITAL